MVYKLWGVLQEVASWLWVVPPLGAGMAVQASGGNGDGMIAIANGTGRHYGNLFSMTESMHGGEPTTAIPDNASYAQIFSHLKRRFTNKVTQTNTVQTIFRDDSSTVLETGSVSDDGAIQIKNKFT